MFQSHSLLSPPFFVALLLAVLEVEIADLWPLGTEVMSEAPSRNIEENVRCEKKSVVLSFVIRKEIYDIHQCDFCQKLQPDAFPQKVEVCSGLV